MASRHATLALGILLAASGCRTAGVGNLAREEPALPQATLTAAEVIREHNRTAERIESLEAHPSITVTSPDGGGVVQGDMAMERPRNFSLVLSGGPSRMKMADIGSNDEEFWFWVKDRSRTKEYYFCEYDETGKSPLATTLQPELIVEALGLRVIPEAEAAGCTIQPGPTPGTLALTYKPTKTQGETFTRMTIFSESSRRIREHRVYSGEGAGKTLLAQAVVKGYQKVPLPSETGGERRRGLLAVEPPARLVPGKALARRDHEQPEGQHGLHPGPPRCPLRGAEAQGIHPGQSRRASGDRRRSRARADDDPRVPHGPADRGPVARTLRRSGPTGRRGPRMSPCRWPPTSPPTPIEPERIVRARRPQAPEPDFMTAGESASTSGWRGRRSVGRE